jgi:hypothetical protein
MELSGRCEVSSSFGAGQYVSRKRDRIYVVHGNGEVLSARKSAV